MDEVKESPQRQRLVAVMSNRLPADLAGLEIELKQFDDYYNFRSPERGSWAATHRVPDLNTVLGANRRPQWSRAAMAINLLEHVATPEARLLLSELAAGHPEAQPTRVAKQALERLNTQKSDRR